MVNSVVAILGTITTVQNHRALWLRSRRSSDKSAFLGHTAACFRRCSATSTRAACNPLIVMLL
jgi:hypothetical protein